jgi:Glycosyltransferase WbsX
VRDFAEGHGKFQVVDPDTGHPHDFRDREPLLGFYDEMSPDVVDAQIQQAASEGIEFFAFYWYINPDTGRESSIDAPLRNFFSSRVRHDMKFMLAPLIATPGSKTISLETWKTTTVPTLVDYISSDSYLRIAGRPVVIDFELPFQGGAAAAYEALRLAVRERLGVSPLIIYTLAPKNTHNDLVFRQKHDSPDGFTCFNMGTNRPAQPYDELVRDWLPRTLQQVKGENGIDPSLMYIPCGSLGVDARPWYGIGWGQVQQDDNAVASRPYVVGVTPALFRQHLADIKAFIDSNEVNTLRAAIIYAWNEWGEGAASIEPSRANGYEYADVIRDVFQLRPRAARPR